MAFKGPSQLKRVCDSMGEQLMSDLSNIRSSGATWCTLKPALGLFQQIVTV